MAETAAHRNWSLRLVLDGVDVSDRLRRARAQRQEDAAAVATFVLAAAGALALPDYVGKAVALDAQLDGDGVWVRLFTGVVDVPTARVFRGELTLQCTDARQHRLNAMSRTALDAALVGPPHPAFVREDMDGAQYAQACMSTRSEALDYSPAGTLRRTPWALTVEHWSFDGADALDGSLAVDMSAAAELVNRHVVTVRARRERYWQRTTQVGWSYQRSFIAYLEDSTTLPTDAEFRQAVQALGWESSAQTFTYLPAPGVYRLTDGSDSIWLGDNNLPKHITDGTATVAKWWTQTLDYEFAVEVRVDQSIARYGARTETSVVNYAHPDGLLEWEGARTLGDQPARANVQTPFATYTYADSADFVADDTPLVQAVAARAARALHGAHREFVAQFSVAFDVKTIAGAPAAVDVAHGARIEHAGNISRGKVAAVVHEFDVATNLARSTITLAVCRGAHPAASAASYAVTLPAALEPAAPTTVTGGAYGFTAVNDNQLGGRDATPYDDARPGYSGMYLAPNPVFPVYPERFELEVPAVPDAYRESAAQPIAVVVALDLPDDEMVVRA